ncbi:MAG: 4-alpha-glucanotransferase [Chitinophagaceae bacterium]|nr:MAG: 4-alpha-glucanotransferase [Chitinophagaceae bacterium]
MKIDFYLRFHTRYGQSLAISGNHLSLGNADAGAALPMQFLNAEFWHASIEVDPATASSLHYHYLLTNEYGERIADAEQHRIVAIGKKDSGHLVLVDTWNYAGEFENAFYTAPFRHVYGSGQKSPRLKNPKQYSHQFRVKAPLLQEQECVCVTGSGPALGEWDSSAPVLLERSGDWWTVKLDIAPSDLPITYKYGIYNFKKGSFVRFEDGDNRSLYRHDEAGSITLLHDGFVRLPNTAWKGAGIAIPVFSLRSAASFGVGEFTDLKLLADWAQQAGMKLIQLLPINDTSATFTYLDSYPYAAISAFALHPQYINLTRAAGKKGAGALKSLLKKQKQLNALPEIDYEEVMKYKMQVLRELYDAEGEEFGKDKDYQDFVAANQHWLKAYAVFSHLRDKFGTADFNQWKTNSVYNEAEVEKLISARSKTAKEIRFYYWVQYHLHLQLKDAVDYIHKKGIVVKGDIPIGIYRYSVDAWQAPQLYHMDWQAGAPPDDFAVKGQNWGFPTYNWEKMQEDGFRWWKQRFEQMSNYFDAFRIDHILGFFRIWSIPLDAVEGILGRFIPALPVRHTEFGERGIGFEYTRYCRPYITDAVLDEVFGPIAGTVREGFLLANDRGGYDLRPEFATQRKVEAWASARSAEPETDRLRQGLYDLISNVLFFEEPGSNGTHFHFRISIESTTSFRHLDGDQQARLRELYVDYFFRRQDGFWKHEALRKLPALKEATNMLICGEDLGMVPASVPDVMKDLGILSLEIQRMPKDPTTEFFHPRTAPYLSVVTPSTHDMSTIRGWWEEDRTRTQRFFNTVLESHGTAPYFCEPWINRAVVLQHLYAPSMWSIFQLQDLLGMSETLRRENPAEERINQPADPKHYWRYRMHLPLEGLIREKEFNTELRDYIVNSGRG